MNEYAMEPVTVAHPLRPAPSDEAYALHLAAHEWSLVQPIIIKSAKDIKSRPNWRDNFEPFEHQVQNLITFCRRLPVTIIADDVGLGKTISAGLVLSELMIRRRVNSALVLCPKILMPQWREELASKFGIGSEEHCGAKVRDYSTRNVRTKLRGMSFIGSRKMEGNTNRGPGNRTK